MLIRSMLRGIPNYLLAIFRVLVQVSKSVDRTMKDFFWEGVDEGEGCTWSSGEWL